jgi:hypothetical protein
MPLRAKNPKARLRHKPCRTVSFSPDRQTLVWKFDKPFGQAVTGKEPKVEGAYVWRRTPLVPTAKPIAWEWRDNTIRLWDAVTGKEPVLEGIQGCPFQLFEILDGKRLFGGGLQPSAFDAQVNGQRTQKLKRR